MDKRGGSAATFGEFYRRHAGEQSPETRETTIEREVPFGAVEIRGKGAGFDFKYKEDHDGPYVEVQYGFEGGWHYVSPPIVVRDRRPAMVAEAQKFREYLDAVQQNATRMRLQDELQEAEITLKNIELKIPRSENWSHGYQILRDAIDAKIHRPGGWTEAEKIELEKLIASRAAVDQMLIELNPQNLEALLSVFQHRVASLRSQMESVPELVVPEVGDTKPREKLRELFSKTRGNMRLATVAEKIGGTQETYLDIVDDKGDPTAPGVVEFYSRKITIPALSPQVAALVQVENILQQGDMSLFENQSGLRRMFEQAGGIERRASFSSGSGCNQGVAYMIVWPSRPDQDTSVLQRNEEEIV